jgi:CRISPR-associated protein Cas2
MKVLVIYDISDNNDRNRLAEDLKKLGLTRIQRSAFIGSIDSSRLKDLMRVCRLRTKEDDVVHIVQLCDYDWRKISVIGKPWNELNSLEGDVVLV